MVDINALPELHEGDQGHIEAHNTIRAILRDHEQRITDLGVRISRMEPRPWIPEDPRRQNPELPEQPPTRQNPELGEQPPAAQPQPRGDR
ncbi:hypothetical protein [Saccharopolyspora rosea]|uniref:Uncharacterized protein n=1 Tax=Saccharopolyspora rosea TaxID=524884 RepID=A0ABW3FK81_9PSEU|nr:hypothetical protein [Saccharopolyspora rosea]